MSTISSLDKTTFVVVNGVRYTIKDYKKMMKEKNGKTKKSKKAKKDVNENAFDFCTEIEKMLSNLKILKSLSAYYDNAHRQWGTIADGILNHRLIRPNFVSYRVKIRECESLINSIKKEKTTDVFQLMRSLAWKLDEVKTCIDSIVDGAKKSGYLDIDSEAITGKGRRLGLKTLCQRATKSLLKLQNLIEEINKIADNGVDPLAYNYNRRRCYIR